MYVLFISVINQLDAQNFCFTISLFHASTCFEHCCAYHQEVKIALHSLWYHHTDASEWSKITEINIKFASTCFGVLTQPSGSLEVVSAKVMNYSNDRINTAVCRYGNV